MTNIPYREYDIEKKLNSVKFRGPDNTGIIKVKDVILGHLRLAILDLEERSNQPMMSGNLYLIYNGEIYNYLIIKDELIALGHVFITNSDSEVLLAGYKQWGAKILERINGMFSFAIYDSTNQSVFCARDRVGVKPFFYYWKEGKFEICSQLRPLINSESTISEEAISIYLDCGYVPSPFSMIKNVYKLPPGNYMVIDLKNKSKSLTEYWNLQTVVENKSIPYEQAKRELHELLIDAVKIRLQSDVPIGSFLSGGVDSALVSSIAAKISKDRINTFTIGFEDPQYDESEIASEFARIIGSIHLETKCSSKATLEMVPKLIEVYDEPFADASALPSLLLNSVTKPYATVALSGDGGDESFLGYNNFDKLNTFIKITKIPFFARKRLANLLDLRIFGNKFDTLKRILRTKNDIIFSRNVFIGYDNLQNNRSLDWLKHYEGYKNWSNNPFQRMADLNIKLWLENDSNVKVDRASMAFSVEVRSPFLDYRVIEYGRSLPINYRFNKGVKKRIIKDILKEYIPEKIFDQPKRGFAVPLATWIREDLKEEIVNELNDEALRKIPDLNIIKFKNQLDEHLRGIKNHSFNIWKVFLLSKWFKEFNL